METTANTTTETKPQHRASTILLVDDEEANRFMLRDVLANSGYGILEAENGREALEAAEAHTPDTVLLDVMMPEMDGFETCRRLKATESTRHIPVLMVSALSDRNNKCEGISAGALDFITKPIDVRDLLLRVDNAVHGKRLVDEVVENANRIEKIENERDAAMKRIVHDLRSPLGGISGNLQLLQMVAAEKLDADELSYLQSSLEGLELLNTRIEALLGSGNEAQN